jgi:hypothetical protein
MVKMSLYRTLSKVNVSLLALFFLWGCGPSIKTNVLVPAKAHEAAMLRRMAVLPFHGPGGQTVASDVEAMLVGIRVDDKPYFSVIERRHVDKVIKEQKFQFSGFVDEKSAIDVAKLLGADGILFGEVSQESEDQRYNESREKCVRYENKKCVQSDKYQVSCVKRSAYFSFSPKVINVASGQVVASEVLSATTEDSRCSDSSDTLQSKTALLAAAKTKAIEKLREILAPYYVTMEIKLITSDDTKMSPQAGKLVEEGVTWAKNGRMDRACEHWHQAQALHGTGYAIPYLLGVCSEVQGNLEGAEEYYRRADRNSGSPVREISEALGRVKLKKENKAKLGEQIKR